MILPGIMATLALLMVTFLLPNDGPRFYIYTNQKDEAVKALLTVYKLDNQDLTRERYAEKVIDYIQSNHL